MLRRHAVHAVLCMLCCAGNIAAEDVEFRETLIANGAVRPLTQLLMKGSKALVGRDKWLNKITQNTHGEIPSHKRVPGRSMGLG